MHFNNDQIDKFHARQVTQNALIEAISRKFFPFQFTATANNESPYKNAHVYERNKSFLDTRRRPNSGDFSKPRDIAHPEKDKSSLKSPPRIIMGSICLRYFHCSRRRRFLRRAPLCRKVRRDIIIAPCFKNVSRRCC